MRSAILRNHLRMKLRALALRISPGIPLKKLIFLLETVLPESPTILNSDKIVTSPNWTLRWSAVESEGELQVTYTVWQKRDSEESWQLENVTRNIFHFGLEDNTSYSFVVKAWNKCGDSMLDRDKMLNISTDFENKVSQGYRVISRETVPTENMVPTGKKMEKKNHHYCPICFFLVSLFSVNRSHKSLQIHGGCH